MLVKKFNIIFIFLGCFNREWEGSCPTHHGRGTCLRLWRFEYYGCGSQRNIREMFSGPWRHDLRRSYDKDISYAETLPICS